MPIRELHSSARDPVRQRPQRRLLLLLAVGLACALIFAVDLFTPLGVADGMLYVAVVLVAMWLPERGAVLAVAGAVSALTVAGYLLSPPGAVAAAPLVNRVFALAAIWATALLAVARLLAEQRLYRQHQLVEGLFETAHAIVLLLDPHGKVLRYNGFAERLLGVPQPEAAGKPWIDTFVPPAEREHVRDILAGSLQGQGAAGNINGVLTRSDGIRQIEWFDTRLRDERGRVAALLAIGTDITEKRRAEDAVRLRDRSLAAAYNGVLIADARRQDCPLIYANAALSTITGYRHAELLGRSSRFLFGAQTDPGAVQAIEQALAARRPCRVTFRGSRKDGSSFWTDLHLTPVADDDGVATHLIGIVNDVTEREQTLIALRTRNLELEALARLSRAFLEGATLDSMRPQIVAFAHEFLGVERVLLLEMAGEQGLLATAGLGWAEGVVGSARVPLPPGSLITRALDCEQPVAVRDLRRDEELTAAGLPEADELAGAACLPFCGRAGVYGLFAVFTRHERWFSADEISFLQTLANTLTLAIERRDDEVRMRRLQRELLRTSRDTALADFGATIAHELNQPVASVMNYAQAAARLAGDGAAAGQVREYLERAVDEAERAGEIMRRLRQLVASGVPERAPASIEEIVRDATRLALNHADHAGAQVTFQFAPDLPAVQVDAIQIQQVVFNLVRNALEAMEEINADAPALRLAARRTSRDRVEVSIEDRGPGLDDGLLDETAGRFDSRKDGGLGIGLSICRSIVGAHGGNLRASPAAGGGTCMRFTVPAAGNGEPR